MKATGSFDAVKPANVTKAEKPFILEAGKALLRPRSLLWLVCDDLTLIPAAQQKVGAAHLHVEQSRALIPPEMVGNSCEMMRMIR